YPNPFNPSTTITYQVKDPGMVTLTVYNLLGQAVQVLVNEHQTVGSYSALFDASSLASGFYFYRLEVNDFVNTKKMMLIK
ncbi:MAG: T9SS type A sorting domain-containing protein, partial [Balneolales bacterium]|nr:T9SS type A sorting domain-containing protein [Balneolales bacterium]